MIEAAMLSAAFVVLSIISMGTGIGYLGYIDFIVPCLISIIYLRCGFKYTMLSSISSLLLIVFVIGDLPSAVFISQSMIFGIICAQILSKKESILDDLFYASILSCIIMILIDFNFSKMTGYSIIKEFENYLPYVTMFSEQVKESIFYISIISIPIGTMLLTYIFALFLGKKFRLLDKEAYKKYTIIRCFKKYGALLSCSRKCICIGVMSIIVISILLSFKFISSIVYLKIILKSIMYVILFFLIQDSISLINKAIFSLTHSRLNTFIFQFILLFSLVKSFKITSIVIIISNLVVDKVFVIKKDKMNF